MIDASVDIQTLNELEDGIHSFSCQMADANRDIEHIINLYFQDFERGIRILEERLHKAEEDLERAEIDLERQRNRRIWVEDEDGDGHWEQVDCSAKESRVVHCQAVYNRCRKDVESCHRIISDARAKRYIHEGIYTLLENKVKEAKERMQPIREKVERHRSIQVPSLFSSTSGTRLPPSSTPSMSPTSTTKGIEMSRPKPPMHSNTTYGLKASPIQERPRCPLSEKIKSAPNLHVTEADRPRSPFSDSRHNTKINASSFWENLDKVFEKQKNNNTDE